MFNFAWGRHVDATMLRISQDCLATTPDDPRFAQLFCRVVAQMRRGFVVTEVTQVDSFKMVWRWGRDRNKYMSWWYRGCVASKSCDSLRTIVRCRELSGGLFFTWSDRGSLVRCAYDSRANVARLLHNSRGSLVGSSRVRLPTIYRTTVARLS